MSVTTVIYKPRLKSSLMAGPSQIYVYKTGKEVKSAVPCVQAHRAHAWLQTMLKKKITSKRRRGNAATNCLSAQRGHKPQSCSPGRQPHGILFCTGTEFPAVRIHTAIQTFKINPETNRQLMQIVQPRLHITVLNCRSGFKSWV